MKRKLTKTEKFLLLTVALIGIFYFYLNKIYDPEIKAFEKVRQEISSLQQEVASLGEVRGARQITDQVEQEKKQVGELEKSLSDELALKKAQKEAEVTEVLDEVSRLAIKNGLVVRELKYKQVQAQKADASPSNPSGYLDWQEHGLVLEGSHRSLVGFIKGLKEMRRYLLIDDIQVKAGDVPGRFEVSIKLLI